MNQTNRFTQTLLASPDLIDELLINLDKIAHEEYGSEGGLPLYDAGGKARMDIAVIQWVDSILNKMDDES